MLEATTEFDGAALSFENVGDRSKGGVKYSFSEPAVNACTPTLSYLDAARLPPKPPLQRSNLTSDGDRRAYSTIFTVPSNHGAGHLARPVKLQWTRPPKDVNDANVEIARAMHANRCPLTELFLRTKRKKSTKICYRCLSSDHLVSQCRDPIKCCVCLRSGHKSSHCKLFNAMSLYSTPPSSPLAPPPSPEMGSSTFPRRSMAEAHVGIGDFEGARCFAYVYLEHAVHSPHLFIRQAMEQAAGALAFQLAASARGAGIMVFNTLEERDEIGAMSPVVHDGNSIRIERHEEADNRFYAFYRVYAAVDFPLEHWDEDRAREALSAVGNVCCLDPACFDAGDFTSIRAVVRLDHHAELQDQLLVRNHNGPACLANLYAIRTWIDVGPEPDWGDYDFGNAPALHGAPYYHPVGNPPTQLPPVPENLVTTVLEWENSAPAPPLHPIRTRRATPYPMRPALLALPWYGVGGVPALPVGVEPGEEASGGVDPVSEGHLEDGSDNVAASELAMLNLADLNLNIDVVHETRSQKRRARRKRAKDSARALRRSVRLMEKEEAGFEMPKDKAARVQQAKFDFSGASRRLRNALSRSYLFSDTFSSSDKTESLRDIAAACELLRRKLRVSLVRRHYRLKKTDAYVQRQKC